MGHLLDRAIDVIEVLARKRRAAKEQVVVRVGYSELVRPDRTQNCHDLTHTRPVHQRHYKRHVSTPRSRPGRDELEVGRRGTRHPAASSPNGSSSDGHRRRRAGRRAAADRSGPRGTSRHSPHRLDRSWHARSPRPGLGHHPLHSQHSRQLGRRAGDRAFALAEHRLGAGRGATSLLGITLGTGVGGGLILGGQLYLGRDGTAGEFGHQTILPDGPRCNCGNNGCLESLARADAIAAACGQPGAEESVAAARAGDPRAQQGLIEVGRYLGIGASNVVVLVGVDRIVVGGGIAAAGDILLDPLRQELARRVHVADVDRVQVVGAELGIWAGAIGAALFAADPIDPHLHFV
ncbi:MAG: ROK family protein [Chloroflexi bacterium]|nr:MAG: ROK family protein [Chloroflexota bacterium]